MHYGIFGQVGRTASSEKPGILVNEKAAMSSITPRERILLVLEGTLRKASKANMSFASDLCVSFPEAAVHLGCQNQRPLRRRNGRHKGPERGAILLPRPFLCLTPGGHARVAIPPPCGSWDSPVAQQPNLWIEAELGPPARVHQKARSAAYLSNLQIQHVSSFSGDPRQWLPSLTLFF